MRVKKFLHLLVLPLLLLGLMLYASPAQAIPSLGVAPSADNPGVYFGTVSGGSDGQVEWDAEYLSYFVTGALPLPTGFTDPGFSMPFSGEDLTVWWGFNQGFPDEIIKGTDVWLLTNSPYGDNFTFGTQDFVQLKSGGQIDGYQRLSFGSYSGYYGVNLGDVKDLLANWVLQVDPGDGSNPFDTPSSREFYFNTGELIYPDFNYGTDWMFAVVGNYSPLGGLIPLNFSPKTTSSSYENPVPEPATMLLLGSGLIGLAGFRRRMRKQG
ncbi:MAG: PEP-CTERM sorting domain-containing protein [Thermodesulfobacteriota bacterium]